MKSLMLRRYNKIINGLEGFTMNVKIKVLAQGCLPVAKTKDSACYDCYANIYDELQITPFETIKIPLGFKLELPKYAYATIKPRSGLTLGGLVAHIGTIDSDYRGELSATITNFSTEKKFVMPRERICQIGFQLKPRVDFEEVAELSETERGENGYGSTGLFE